jgi:hypothetical protein
MAYYSLKSPQIYHVCLKCKVGNNIEKRNLCKGQSSEARLCKNCAKLQRKRKCTLGTPTPAEVRVRRTRVVTPHYSKERPEIYHECANCYLGNNIEGENLIEGKPRGAKLCKNCAGLQKKDRCILGVPIPAKP